MAYIVPGMKLIPQQMKMSCWYASMQMLIKWREEKDQKSYAHLISPEFDSECVKVRDSDKGVRNPQIIRLAEGVGLKHVPPMTPTPGAIEKWLKAYGPLWVNGKNHIVVVAGIMNMGFLGDWLLVYDPSPINVGKIEWRSLTDWYAMGSSSSSRDTANNVEAVFLYVPSDI